MRFAALALFVLGGLWRAEAMTAEIVPGSESLRAAVQDLTATFGARYPRGQEFLARLGEIERRWAGEADRTAASAELEKLRRDALHANPLVCDQPILFVTRPQYVNEHGTEETMYQSNEHNARCFRGGGALKALDPRSGAVTTLLQLPEGIVRDPDVHFDGRRILFSMRRNRQDDYHLYEIDSDGRNLRQLTFAPRVTDIHPVYLPSGQILFSSTRDPKYIPCQRHLMANLFVMDGDGANIHQIGFNTQFEGRASLMPDGRVLYTRWEYVDKHFSSAYGLWTTNPDGTNQALFYGGYAWQPGAIVDARCIPGSHRVVCTFTSVHDLGWGAMAVVDPRHGSDGPRPVMHSWPRDLSPYLRQWDAVGRVGGEYDSFMRLPVKYEHPYPLSDKYFLCARMLAPKNPQMALFVVDVFGNGVLLHSEPPGCFEPMPLAPRPRPPALPDRTNLAEAEGSFYVFDVCRGSQMTSVPRGTIKTLRVVEAPPKLTYAAYNHGDWAAPTDGDSHHPTALNWNHYNAKRVLGTVPVEADGSAYFTAPAGRFLFFQLLDAEGLMVYTMRSGTTLQPGEQASCVRCHDYGGKAADKLILAGDLGPAFNASYVALMAKSPGLWTPPKAGEPKPLVSSAGAGPVQVIGPYAWGSRRSRLTDHLRSARKDGTLSAEDFDRVVTWIDLNAPYYPDHDDYYTANPWGRARPISSGSTTTPSAKPPKPASAKPSAKGPGSTTGPAGRIDPQDRGCPSIHRDLSTFGASRRWPPTIRRRLSLGQASRRKPSSTPGVSLSRMRPASFSPG